MLKWKLPWRRGRKTYDKRENLKEKDTKREIDRMKKSF